MSQDDLRLDVSTELKFRSEGPYTRKLVQTERSIVMVVCLEPGQVIPPHSHVSREAFVYGLQGHPSGPGHQGRHHQHGIEDFGVFS